METIKKVKYKVRIEHVRWVEIIIDAPEGKSLSELEHDMYGSDFDCHTFEKDAAHEMNFSVREAADSEVREPAGGELDRYFHGL